MFPFLYKYHSGTGESTLRGQDRSAEGPGKSAARTAVMIISAYFSVDNTRPVLLYLSLLKTSAGVAQLVERDLAKVEVTGSSPATRSIRIKGLAKSARPFCFAL
jgi:hypothetical protein